MSICPNPKCNGYCAQCPKVSLSSDSRHVVTNGRTYYDLDAEHRIRDAEGKVVEAAEARTALMERLIDGSGVITLLDVAAVDKALLDAVRALRAAREA